MAVSSTQLLRVIQQFRRYYDRHFSELLSRTGLSMREMHVVLFLANHPAHDTARDVTELRGLAKRCPPRWTCWRRGSCSAVSRTRQTAG